jgi:hypothetical protein
MDVGELTLEIVEPLVGDAFTIAAEPAPIGLALETAVALGEWPGGRQPFSLTFRGPPDPVLQQGIYQLEHAELGALEIFIVPIGKDADGTSYEAIFT